MFCFDTVKEREVPFNPIGCSCCYKCHGNCLQEWFEQKQQYECPICHTVSIPNPIQEQPVIRVVYIQRDQQGNNDTIVIREQHQKCIGVCCLGILFWVVLINVIEFVLYKH